MANIVCPLFGGIPATGAIARTATNVRNGGRTPLAGIIHSLVLLHIMLAFGHWATLIPQSVLAAILMVVAYNMSEWLTFRALLKSPRSDVTVLVATFLQVDAISEVMAGENAPTFEPAVGAKRRYPKGVEVFDIQGPLFFGAA